MKRCLQCHFTFEDDKQFCDFDHTELTPDPEPLPFSQNVSAQSPFLRFVRSRVSLAILALAGVSLSALLIGYLDSASQANVDIGSNAESRDAAVSLVPPADAPVQPLVQIASPDTLTTRSGITAIKDSSPLPRRPTTASRSRARLRSSTPVRKHTRAFENAQQTRTFENAHLKKESKATAILKKTGSVLKKTVSILKKPFEL